MSNFLRDSLFSEWPDGIQGLPYNVPLSLADSPRRLNMVRGLSSGEGGESGPSQAFLAHSLSSIGIQPYQGLKGTPTTSSAQSRIDRSSGIAVLRRGGGVSEVVRGVFKDVIRHLPANRNRFEDTNIENKYLLEGDEDAYRSIVGAQGPRMLKNSPRPRSEHLRTISLHKKQEDHEWGFGVRDQRDNGIGLYVNKVDPGSPAERHGLRIGEVIVAIDDIRVQDIADLETLQDLLNSPNLLLTVASASTYLEGADAGSVSYQWCTAHGEPVSPPPSPLHGGHRIRTVEIVLEPSDFLGLTIRGGKEFGLGIYVSEVQHMSPADVCGIQIGDQILEANGVTFTSITHQEAVRLLKKARRFLFRLRYVGRVPNSAAFDEDVTVTDLRKSSLTEESRIPSALQCAELEMVMEKARCVLNKSDRARLDYYCNEYRSQGMTIDSFVAVLMEILSDEDKRTLLTELRELVSQEDLPTFDSLIYGTFPESVVTPTTSTSTWVPANNGNKRIAKRPNLSNPLEMPREETRTPSDDSGVDVANNGSQIRNGRAELLAKQLRLRRAEFGATSSAMEMSSSIRRSLSGDLESSSELGVAMTNHVLAPSLLGTIAEFPQPLKVKRKKHVCLDVGNQGTMRLRIRKTHPSLGIAIEGGEDTGQKTPRIISISPNGAAFEAGGLAVGQDILEVDGHSTIGKTHEQIAQLVARSYTDMSRQDILFLVAEGVCPKSICALPPRQGTPLIIGEDISDDAIYADS